MELSNHERAEAVASLKRYAAENLAEPLGDLAAGMLLDFFLEDIGPVVYNRAVTDAQSRMNRFAEDLTGDLHEKPFGYWARLDAKRNARR